MSTCQLCGLPTPDPPVTGAGVSGSFCCQGCLEVSRALDERGLEDGELRAAGETVTGPTAANEGPTVPDDAAEAYLAVEGMHCTTCEAFLSLRGDELDGVYGIEANYGMGTARVHYDPDRIDRDDLPALLSGRGYRFRFHDQADAADARTHRQETAERLLVGGFLTMLVMPWYVVFLYPSYVGFGTGVLDVDATGSVGLYVPMVLIALASGAVLVYTGGPTLRGAWISVRTRQPNMDLLVAVAALSAYGYSTVALATGSTHLYYDVSVAIVMVVTLGRYYEDRVRSRATGLLSAVTATHTGEATRVTEGGREAVPVDALEPGDRVVVPPGERVPADGTVLEGVAAVDESVLTGESLPVTKSPGEQVVGGSVVTDDALVVAVGSTNSDGERVVESTADRIATALWEIQTSSAGVQRFADALATVFVPLVLALGVAVAGWQVLSGASIATAVLSGLVVLVVSCPCALGLATPLALSAGLRDGLRRGVVVTNESVFELAPEADVVLFDKTGTLTAGELRVTDAVGDGETLRFAAAVERFSGHPVADAILAAVGADGSTEPTTASTASDPVTDGGAASTADDEAESGSVGQTCQDWTLPEARDFTRHPGEGVSGTVEGRRVVVGTPDLVADRVGPIPSDLEAPIERAQQDGGRAVVVGWEGRARGVIRVGDRERERWERAIEAFADRELAVLTGDGSPASERFREHPAVDRVFAGVPPDGKVETVRRLSATGTTVMVGDGTNDAPALAAADLGIAMGDGTARAVDAADVVVTDGDLTAVESVFGLARGTRRRIRENVAWAFCYNAVAIPLAVAGLINPLFAALAMAASSLIVVSNSRRPVLSA